MTDLAINALLHKRDELLGELLALCDRMASLYNDIKAIDRVLDTLGYDGPRLAEGSPGRQDR